MIWWQWSGETTDTARILKDTGRILKTSGIRYTWDANLAVEARVLTGSVEIGNAPSELDATYTVTVNSFIAAGSDNFSVLPLGNNRIVGPTDLDALTTYLSGLQQPFSHSIKGRIQKLNLTTSNIKLFEFFRKIAR